MAVYFDDFFIRLMKEIWIFLQKKTFSQKQLVLVEHTFRFGVLNII